jgi:hypothetical protein
MADEAGDGDEEALACELGRQAEEAAATALAAGLDGEGLLRDVLVVVGRACRDHGAALGLATGPAAGNA